MGKFEVEFELQGLKLRMKGERGDIPLIAQHVGKQVENLIKPAVTIVEDKPQMSLPIGGGPVIDVPTSARRRRTSKTNVKQHDAGAAAMSPPEVTIDPQAWGSPNQKWKGSDKAIWLLYAVANSGGPNELTSAQITTIFNTKFREAGTLLRQNVNRDLMKLKGSADGLVGRSDQTDAWFLTDAGKKHAIDLITKVREQSTPSAN